MPDMRLISIMLLLQTVLTTGLSGCPEAGAARDGFSVAWNYDTSGYLEVCGCSAHQLGGLPRRASKLTTLEALGPVLKIEGAHIFEEAGTFQMLKGEAIVKSLAQMDYDVLVLGVREAQQGASELDRLDAMTEIPFVSANVFSAGKAYAKPLIHVQIAGNDVAITAVSQPDFVTFDLPQGMTIADPDVALQAALAEAKQADMRIVCLEGDDLWIRDMKQKYASQADLFLTGSRDPLTSSLDFDSDPPSINNWKLGRYMSLVTVDPLEGQGYSMGGINLPLSEELVDDARIAAVLDEFKTGLKDVFADIMPFDEDEIYYPPEYCATCHQPQYDSYMASGHSRARLTLEENNQLYNLDCIRCHIVYDSDENELQPMNCISCHTNIVDAHVYEAMDDPSSIQAPDPPVTTYDYAFCSRCHDEINSTPFKEHWPQYVNRIYHGGDMSRAEEAAIMLGIDIKAEPPGHGMEAEAHPE
jgi:hypothetical protein